MEQDEDVRKSIIETIDSFIDRIQQQKGIMIGMAISALIMAPITMILSVYLLTHPRFFHTIEKEVEFGAMLNISLIIIPIMSAIWLITGVRQYRSLNSWNKKYSQYLQKKNEVDKTIQEKFDLEDKE